MCIRDSYSAGVLKKEYLLDSLRQLQVYRFLCGLKYDLELHRPFNELAQHAALVCAANRKMSHSPRRPPGMAADVFALGSKGAGSSNLHQQQASLLSAINGFMADEDASNIAATGHRAWCLNPQMRRTGLGECDRYQAMYAFDNSRSGRGKTIDTIFFPNRGYYPVEYFGWNWPWSVSFPTGKYSVPKKSELKVEVWQLDKELLKVVKLKLDYLGVRSESFGMGPGVIFRPVLFSRGSLAGNIFLVSMRWGATVKSAVGIDYVVGIEYIIGNDKNKTNVLKFNFFFSDAIANPMPIERPIPRDPVENSIPSFLFSTGCPSKLLPSSSKVFNKPTKENPIIINKKI
mgnify:CR=1 FL=1